MFKDRPIGGVLYFFRENKTSDRKTVNSVRFDVNSSLHFRFGIDYHNLALIV